VSVLREVGAFLAGVCLGMEQRAISNLYQTEQILISHLSIIVVKEFAYTTSLLFGRTAPVILDMALTSRLTQGEVHSSHVNMPSERAPFPQKPPDSRPFCTSRRGRDRCLSAGTPKGAIHGQLR
jgi:hypothetical protein